MENWKTDSNGRRYRDVTEYGINVREYEPTITTAGTGTVTQEQLRTIHETQPLPNMDVKAKEETYSRCPFTSAIDPKCYRELCALYENGCGLSKTIIAQAETIGRRCPFSATACTKECAIYDNGCTLVKKGI